ncbi:FeoA family protein [Nostoc sp. DedSLP04]|uniref:FeoA family protein n=1 Tax=Nostoc sp. DedSLP04 TaxID=3075401 RepID=UPI002AD523E5|nr:FeoA family protein [Nostoc sp. DedSLP04]MDZ8034201.1 FeoA family protein [Nostoc sp. DedSLP04]
MHIIELTSLKSGETAIICGLSGETGLQQRLLSLGFRTGRQVLILRKAWLNGPLHIRVGTTEVMVRRRDAKAIQLTKDTCKTPK